MLLLPWARSIQVSEGGQSQSEGHIQMNVLYRFLSFPHPYLHSEWLETAKVIIGDHGDDDLREQE